MKEILVCKITKLPVKYIGNGKDLGGFIFPIYECNKCKNDKNSKEYCEVETNLIN